MPNSIEQQADGSFSLLVDCADDVSARVSESTDEVRIDRIHGDLVDGDCLGETPLGLAAPIGDRRLIVDDALWKRVDDDCELAVYSFEDVAERLHWAVRLPCPS